MTNEKIAHEASSTKVSADYHGIIKHYENCLAVHGDTCRGVDWPNPEGAFARYRVMLDVLGRCTKDTSILDVGCGAGHLLEYMRAHSVANVEYIGLDLSQKFIDLCKSKFQNENFFCLDVLTDNELWAEVPSVDYAILNGVFTERQGVPNELMMEYMIAILKKIFRKVRVGVAFNVMSKHVDWEREDLFHVPYDALAMRLRKDISRHFTFRADYGLYEYTAYVFKHPR